jgi:DNA-directed RNA polymerase subunit F
MAKLQDIVEELKTLPPEGLERVAEYIHGLHANNQKERKALLRRAAGTLSNEEADELARIIEEGCEQIDERDW